MRTKTHAWGQSQVTPHTDNLISLLSESNHTCALSLWALCKCALRVLNYACMASMMRVIVVVALALFRNSQLYGAFVHSLCVVLQYASSHDKTDFNLERGSDILMWENSRHALESGLFPLSQHPIYTRRVKVVPLVLNPQLLPRRLVVMNEWMNDILNAPYVKGVPTITHVSALRASLTQWDALHQLKGVAIARMYNNAYACAPIA